MDADVFPNSIEYWGPNGMAFYRNVQVRWMPIQGDTRLTFAAERPGATGDAGPAQERVDLMTIVARYPVPDLSGEFRWAGSHGYVKLSGVLRYITWDDLTNDGDGSVGKPGRLGHQPELDGQAVGQEQPQAAGHLRARHRQLHERQPAGHRRAEQPRRPDEAAAG